ncbi:MAG: hypothetical protein NZM38_03295 [Cytophagales bacterium]|nr:hypothetical protein [Cytophagales bacterium]MDW8383779.1 hypothetical protein [Flammeovirgaceae bacterium]
MKFFCYYLVFAICLDLSAQNKTLNAQASLFKTLKIKEYAVYETIMLGDSVVQKKYLSELVKLNPDGTVAEEYDYNPEGNLEGFISQYEYKNGNLVRQTMQWIEQQERDIIEYEYQNGLLVKQKEYEAGILVGWHQYQYDKKKNIIRQQYFASDGKPDTSVRYHYQNGLLVQQIRLNEMGEIIFSSVKEYSKQGWLLKEIIQEGKKGEQTQIVQTYTYDKQGKLLKNVQQNLAGNPIFEVDFQYDSKGLLQKVTFYDHMTTLFTIEEYEYHYL